MVWFNSGISSPQQVPHSWTNRTPFRMHSFFYRCSGRPAGARTVLSCNNVSILVNPPVSAAVYWKCWIFKDVLWYLPIRHQVKFFLFSISTCWCARTTFELEDKTLRENKKERLTQESKLKWQNSCIALSLHWICRCSKKKKANAWTQRPPCS